MSYTAPDLADDAAALVERQGYRIEESEEGFRAFFTKAPPAQRIIAEWRDDANGAVMDALEHMAARLAPTAEPEPQASEQPYAGPNWIKVAGLNTWAYVTNDAKKQGGAWEGKSGDFRGRTTIGTIENETRHPSLVCAMSWVEQELAKPVEETEEERLERAFQEARDKWGAHDGTLRDLCAAIRAGYEAGHTMYDDDMIGLAEGLTNNVDQIIVLAEKAGALLHAFGGDTPEFVRKQAADLEAALRGF